MFAPNSAYDTYKNYNSNGNSQGARAFRAFVNQNIRGACQATPERLINVPRNMNYTGNRLTANDHAGKLFEDVIDHVRELKVKADRWDAHEAQQGLDGDNQPTDLFNNNPDPATRRFLDEAIYRFIDVRLRSRTYSLE